MNREPNEVRTKSVCPVFQMRKFVNAQSGCLLLLAHELGIGGSNGPRNQLVDALLTTEFLLAQLSHVASDFGVELTSAL